MAKKNIDVSKLLKSLSMALSLCVILNITNPSSAYAACANPAGVAGDMMYNSSFDVMQFCDGTDWTAMKGDGSGDNLGNHTATQNLAMGAFDITGTGTVTAGSLVATSGSGLAWENGVNRMTHNDGGGNVQIRFGNEFATSDHRFTHGGGAAWITSNIDATANTNLTMQVSSNPGAGAGSAVTWGSPFRITATDVTFGGTSLLTGTGDNLGAGGSGDLITDGTIDSSEIEDNTLTAADIAANAITGSELAGNAVTSGHIVDATITAADLAADSVGASEIAAGAVGTSEVADNSLSANDIAGNAIGQSELAGNAVTSGHIVDLTIATGDIAPQAVTNGKISNSTIVATQKLSATGTKDATTFLRGDNTWAPAGADNLGDHTATQDLNMSDNKITNVNAITFSMSSGAPPTK